MLLPYLQHAEGPVREVLGRVLGEIATPSLGTDLLQFVDDEIAELRAAAARALSQVGPALALDVLKELAHDSIWFVRLRAIVSLGKLFDQRAIPVLLEGLMDSNRLVRLRAAEGLIEFKAEMAAIFEQVVATGDQYGLHAYVTALENAGLRASLEHEIEVSTAFDSAHQALLREVLQAGKFAASKSGVRNAPPVNLALPQ
jgi:HEAT repeat protein